MELAEQPAVVALVQCKPTFSCSQSSTLLCVYSASGRIVCKLASWESGSLGPTVALPLPPGVDALAAVARVAALPALRLYTFSPAGELTEHHLQAKHTAAGDIARDLLFLTEPPTLPVCTRADVLCGLASVKTASALLSKSEWPRGLEEELCSTLAVPAKAAACSSDSLLSHIKPYVELALA